MTPNQTAVDRLVAAQLCQESNLSENDKHRLNSLSDEEVDQLIALHQKLGTAESDAARPNFPI
jgi:hypothetical protein